MESKTVVVDGQEFYLDPDRLTFNEASLTKYLQDEAAWYNYAAQKLTDAETEAQRIELNYDVKYAEKFRSYKEQGGSDKLAESNSKADIEVETIAKMLLDAKNVVQSLKRYLAALDKAHENAQSFGHNLRKEMDKLFNSIKQTTDSNLEKQIDAIIAQSH